MIEIKHVIVYGEFTQKLNNLLREGWEIDASYAEYNQVKDVLMVLYILKREVKTGN